MANGWRSVGGVAALLLLGLATRPSHADTLSYVPVALGWSAAEVERATSGNLRTIADKAEATQQLGCRRHCERLQRVFDRLTVQARGQSPHAAALRCR
ncbi:MAG: hypothetical protein ABIR94_15570 [Rubrivivax sp.]